MQTAVRLFRCCFWGCQGWGVNHNRVKPVGARAATQKCVDVTQRHWWFHKTVFLDNVYPFRDSPSHASWEGCGGFLFVILQSSLFLCSRKCLSPFLLQYSNINLPATTSLRAGCSNLSLTYKDSHRETFSESLDSMDLITVTVGNLRGRQISSEQTLGGIN